MVLKTKPATGSTTAFVYGNYYYSGMLKAFFMVLLFSFLLSLLVAYFSRFSSYDDRSHYAFIQLKLNNHVDLNAADGAGHWVLPNSADVGGRKDTQQDTQHLGRVASKEETAVVSQSQLLKQTSEIVGQDTLPRVKIGETIDGSFMQAETSTTTVAATAGIKIDGYVTTKIDSDQMTNSNTASTEVDNKEDVKTNPSLSASDGVQSVPNESFMADQQQLINANVTCKIPHLDPFDKEILPYIEHPRQFQCDIYGFVQPELTYVDKGMYLVLNDSALAEENAKLSRDEKIQCFYSVIQRPPLDDYNLTRGAQIELVPGARVPVPGDTVAVLCKVQPPGSTVYQNTHAIFSKEELGSKVVGQESEDRLSVLMLFIDSTSLSMFRRQLPDTYAYMTEVMGFNVFKSYNKVGYNSFPNLIPILTGKRVYSFRQDSFEEELNDEWRPNKANVDHWPFIWKTFSQNGYVTSHNDDSPFWPLLTFYEKPVDHYFRPFWLRVSENSLGGGAYCYGNHPKPRLLLNIAQQMYDRYEGQLKFMYAYICEISHNKPSNLEMADTTMAKFFKDMYEGNRFNKSAVFVMSDHGLVFGEQRKTFVGSLEERLPIFSLWFPNWFYQKHPHIRRNLLLNQNRLSANFDVRATLLDIIHSNFSRSQHHPSQFNFSDLQQQQKLQQQERSRARSQLFELPPNRSCRDAGIPLEFCACGTSAPMNVHEQRVQLAAQFLVEKINNLTRHALRGTNCAQFTLTRALRAEESDLNVKIVHTEDTTTTNYKPSNIKIMRVAVEVEPGGGQFEAMVNYHNESLQMSLTGEAKDISRINAYGVQSKCTTDPFLKKFCFCI